MSRNSANKAMLLKANRWAKKRPSVVFRELRRYFDNSSDSRNKYGLKFQQQIDISRKILTDLLI
jgi:hypothetical protein